MTTKEFRKRIALSSLAMGGGDGKTWTGQLMRTLCVLLGIPLSVLDADQGNRAFSLTAPDVVAIDIMAKPEVNLAKVRAATADGRAIILDAGANALADSVDFINFLMDFAADLRREGYLVKGLYVVSTNKVGAAAVLEPVAERFSFHYDQVWVFNDRDGSGEMPEGYKPHIIIKNLHPGFVRLVNDRGFVPLIVEGEPGYQLSCDHIAAYMWEFANQRGVRAIFGDEAIDSLAPLLNRVVPCVTTIKVKTLLDDAEFRSHAARAKVVGELLPHLGGVDDHINEARAEVLHVLMPYLHNVDASIEALQAYKSTKGT